MENNYYSGLSRTFEAYFPQVKESVKQTIEFFNAETFTLPTPKVDETQSAFVSDFIPTKKRREPIDKLIGKFTIEEGEEDSILPKLKYEVQSGCGKNPRFYLVTTPTEDVIYIGTTEDGKRKKSVSASTLTGGLLPPHENRAAYCAYLGIMSAVKKFGYALIYEVDTQYNNTFIDQYGDKNKISPTNIIIDNIVNELYDAAEIHGHLGIFSIPGCDEEKSAQAKTSISIWNSVKAFFNMYKNGALNVKGNASNGEEIKVAVVGKYIMMDFSSNFEKEIRKNKLEKEDKKMRDLISEKAIMLCSPYMDNYKCSITDLRTKSKFCPEPVKNEEEETVKEYGKEILEYEEKIHSIIKQNFCATYLNIGYVLPNKVNDYSTRRERLSSPIKNSKIILSFNGADNLPSKDINEIVRETELLLGICIPDAKIVVDFTTTEDEITIIERDCIAEVDGFIRRMKRHNQ